MNTIMTGDQIEEEIERIVTRMSDDERVHLRSVLYAITRCYDKDNTDCAVVVLGTAEGIDSFVSLNCTPMMAATLMEGANDFLGYLNTKDAPPKEMFN
jgi:hypothetical protein